MTGSQTMVSRMSGTLLDHVSRPAEVKAAKGDKLYHRDIQLNKSLAEDSSALSPETRQAIYKDLQREYPWSVYAVGYFHLMIYLVVFVITYVAALQTANSLLCIPLGWSGYCLWMLGHECYHGTMAPNKAVNELIGYITMDIMVTYKQTWKYWHHTIHHRLSWSQMDRQHLHGPNLFFDWAQLMYTFLGYQADDVRRLVAEPSLPKAFALIVRFIYLFALPLNCLVGTFAVFGCCANYFGLLGDSIPCMKPTKDPILEQLRGSLDFLPNSNFMTILSAALNSHVTHHVYPSLPRSLHPKFGRRLKELCPDEYKCVEDWSTLFWLWIIRNTRCKEVVPVKDFKKLALSTPWWGCRQLLEDALGVVVLTLMTAYTPSTRLLFA